ncbi:MAG: nitroreductase family protein [Tannerella sp.]|jgi:nitroreductase|nr:nitroreductase family protein [Tannerella sp.]
MDSFTSLITGRRSTRKFQDKALAAEEMELILKAALMAPTSKSAYSWEFVVVNDADTLRQLASCKKNGATFLDGCSSAVVVLGNTTSCDVWIEDASIASIFMQLQAEDLGIGSCWCQVRGRRTVIGQDSEEFVRDLLGIPGQFGVLSIIGFGYKDPDCSHVPKTGIKWDKVHTSKFKTPVDPLQA